jgi:hypothetical protein
VTGTPSAGTVEVEYTDSPGTKVRALVSEPIEVIPEPSTFVRLAAGLACTSVVPRRMRTA